jgi:two-component system response regulator RegA
MNAIRVLLVDDEVDFTEVLSQRMSSRGLRADVCSNGSQALEMAEHKIYDAVVLDMAMPGMNGMETLRRLLLNNPDLQVIFLTGRATLEHGIEAMRSGAMEFFEKPPDIDKLIAKITEAREKRERLTEQRLERAVKDLIRNKGW